MTYKAPLLNEDFILTNDHYSCLTSAQLAKFAQWSIECGKPVVELMAGFMVEQDQQWNHMNGDPNAVVLTGTLPHCNLFGGLMPDGSTHT
tara:strand:+ start:506 stop:775 length:270 start_codon:yes stop_codon:yes gene_type:complete